MLPTEHELETLNTAMGAGDSRNAVGFAARNLFVLGCWLHATGREDAGIRAVKDALAAARTSTTLSRRILRHLPGNERTFARAIWASAEINELLFPLKAD